MNYLNPFRYIGGFNIKQVLNTSLKYQKKNIIPVINFSIEKPDNKLTIQKVTENYYELLKNIKIMNKSYPNYSIIKNYTNTPSISFKFSSVNYNYESIDSIVNKCHDKNIKICLDVEDDINYNTYIKYTDKLIHKYNYDNNITVIKSYQMYRKNSLYTLMNDVNYYNNNNIPLGVKIVRGAYYKKDINSGNLITNKYDCDASYDSAMIYLNNNNYNGLNIIATHNYNSIKLLNNLCKYENKSNLQYAYLMGIINLRDYNINHNIPINIYIPYGNPLYLFPYLIRRFIEVYM